MKLMTKRILGASSIAFLLVGAAALAQTPETVRVRATIEKIDGRVLDVKSREGAMLKVKVADNGPVNEITKASLSDIKEGSYLSITAMPQPDGSQKAVAIFIFPPSVHPPERFSSWDFLPNSTMTNATVANQVVSADGHVLLVNYKDGEKKILVPPDAVIVTAKKASIDDLKVGQKIFVIAAKKLPDGTLEAPNVGLAITACGGKTDPPTDRLNSS